ncbi:hypothetical protein LTR91_003446 [Friedmanniomyces endolithicus]|uniref:Uncharacterized protein n=1 Tax=Friedmanniomyces endolithicus TaxID=329885 RepID=A0AAN6KW71_9PEZI|nr:hypothetical protein LTR94_001651 [Friedmanniomyces endolithicus]KAK0793052.1 hypothetical protein LTR75_011284 [Friedmanniomyces endolithicus]KAK0800846.1 hypothetical protein LTR38_007012 [Friedmanniomyces endolithicus]KAK0808082.1 hypothetical protein LTR59_003141 [Friedmanniomyces endolithicus]KAK0827229.1 hypothetical protein LTR03_016949 [Friedmanniomyces endolithicus]
MFPDLPRTSLDRTMEHHEQLPPYSNDGQLPAYITEKHLPNHQRPHSKAPSKMSTFKSILTGDVHKHNPRYTLEESVTGQRTVPRPTTSVSSESRSDSKSRSPKLNPTLKSILTGDVHKHNPRYVLEESVTGQRSHARSTNLNTSDPKSKSTQSTLKSILTGDVHKYHPMYRLEESADASMRSRR